MFIALFIWQCSFPFYQSTTDYTQSSFYGEPVAEAAPRNFLNGFCLTLVPSEALVQFCPLTQQDSTSLLPHLPHQSFQSCCQAALSNSGPCGARARPHVCSITSETNTCTVTTLRTRPFAAKTLLFLSCATSKGSKMKKILNSRLF